MQTKAIQPRIIAIDIRASRLGYAVFEGPEHLIDWGTSAFQFGCSSGTSTVHQRIVTVLRVFVPSAIVVKKGLRENSVRAGQVLRLIRREAAARSIPVVLVDQREVKQAFHAPHRIAKHIIATAVAEKFPELLWKLPGKFRIWQGEHHIMAVFDAIAAGYAYWQQGELGEPP